MAIEPGQELLHYRLIEKIGQGGMGVVWRAADTTLDREVAIKVLPETLAADAQRLARLEREAKLAASLNHPNIATVHGLHEVPSTVVAAGYEADADLADAQRFVLVSEKAGTGPSDPGKTTVMLVENWSSE